MSIKKEIWLVSVAWIQPPYFYTDREISVRFILSFQLPRKYHKFSFLKLKPIQAHQRGKRIPTAILVSSPLKVNPRIIDRNSINRPPWKAQWISLMANLRVSIYSRDGYRRSVKRGSNKSEIELDLPNVSNRFHLECRRVLFALVSQHLLHAAHVDGGKPRCHVGFKIAMKNVFPDGMTSGDVRSRRVDSFHVSYFRYTSRSHNSKWNIHDRSYC